MDEETKAEIEHIIKIATAVGGLGNGISWIEKNSHISLIPEPDYYTEKVKWVRWYRNLYGVALKVAVDEGKARHE